MTSKSEATRGLLIAISAVVAGCVALGLLSTVAFDPSSTLINRYKHQLDSVPDDQVAQHLHEMANLGDTSIRVLVQLMASDREVVANSATRELRDKLADWRMLPSSESSLKVGLLANELVNNIGDVEPKRRMAAADLSTEILTWPIDQSAVDKDMIITNCEQILRLVATNSIRLQATNRSTIKDPTRLPAQISDVPVLSRRQSSPEALR